MWRKLFAEIKAEDKIYFYWGDKTALIVPYLKKNIGNKVYVRFHGSDLYEKAKGYIPFRKYLLSEIDRLITISEDGKSYLTENYSFVDYKKISVSRLGVFDNGLNADKKEEKAFHLLSCSNIIPLKRIHLIIEALRYIDFKVKWTHIGSGILFENIKTEAKSLPDNIYVN